MGSGSAPPATQLLGGFVEGDEVARETGGRKNRSARRIEGMSEGDGMGEV